MNCGNNWQSHALLFYTNGKCNWNNLSTLVVSLVVQSQILSVSLTCFLLASHFISHKDFEVKLITGPLFHPLRLMYLQLGGQNTNSTWSINCIPSIAHSQGTAIVMKESLYEHKMLLTLSSGAVRSDGFAGYPRAYPMKDLYDWSPAPLERVLCSYVHYSLRFKEGSDCCCYIEQMQKEMG